MNNTVVKLEGITKIYKEGPVQVVAIKDINLEVKRGEIVLIMGPSGSGKTTLLSIIGCILKPSKGCVFIKGENVTNLDERALPRFRRNFIGFIFQTFNLIGALTAKENVEIVLNLNNITGKEADNQAKRILYEVGLKERVNFLPKDLSGGEMQRVSIARALVHKPSIVLADEPTGNLDSNNGRMVMELLKKLSLDMNTAVMIVTHDTRFMNIANRILYLEDGILKDEGI